MRFLLNRNILIIAILLSLATGVWFWHGWNTKKFHEVFTEAMLLRECDPEVVILQIKKNCGVEIPDTAEKILAAKNIGSWDSSEQDFVLRFLINTEHIPDFVKSLPGDIVQKEYTLKNDSRNSKQLNQPAWFLEPILGGAIIEGIGIPNAKGVIELTYIDTSSPEKSLVYIMGLYIRGNEKD